MLGGIVTVKTEAVDLSKDCREWKWFDIYRRECQMFSWMEKEET